MKNKLMGWLILFTIIVFGWTIGSASTSAEYSGANAPGRVASFSVAETRWLVVEDWTQPGHPQATFARQRDGNWYSVNWGYELDYQIHFSQAAAIDALVQSILELPVIQGPLADVPGLQIQSTQPGLTPPDFAAELKSSTGEYHWMFVYPIDGRWWMANYDSLGHFNYYEVGDDAGVMAAMGNVTALSGS